MAASDIRRLKGDFMIQYLDPATIAAVGDTIFWIIVAVAVLPFVVLGLKLWIKR